MSEPILQLQSHLTDALSVRSLSKRWHKAPAWIRALIRTGKLAAFDVGESRPALRISPEEVHRAETELFAVKRPTPRRRKVDEYAGISASVRKLLGIGGDQ